MKHVKRLLTAGEIFLARSIYKSSIDYSKVVVHDRSHNIFARNTFVTPRGEIFTPRGEYRPDYSSETIDLQFVFIHELTHVWQYQNRVIRNLTWRAVGIAIKKFGAYGKAYRYSIDAGKDLIDYGMEQQAAIIGDYFLAKNGYLPVDLIGGGSMSPSDYETTVLARFVANPSYAKQ